MNADRDLRDPALDALLRDHSSEMPPDHVDAAILAAAHRAVDSVPRASGSPKATRSWRWWMPVAAAAVIGVVVIGIMPLAPTTHDEASSTVSDSPDTSRRDGATVVELPAMKAESGSADLARRIERGDSPPRDASGWIARIRALRQEGKLPEATQELARFRAAFDDADARLPADLQVWATTVPR